MSLNSKLNNSYLRSDSFHIHSQNQVSLSNFYGHTGIAGCEFVDKLAKCMVSLGYPPSMKILRTKGSKNEVNNL